MRTSIEVSLGASGKDTVEYHPKTVLTVDLPQTLKGNNYATIIWRGGYRDTDYFERATGICIDIDRGMALDDAKKMIEKRKVHAFIATTKSHQKEKKNGKGEVIAGKMDRFRVIIPFNRMVYTYENYKAIGERITGKNGLFPECDPSVLDGGRQFFASPDDCLLFDYMQMKGYSDYNVDDGMKNIQEAWSSSLKVRTAKGKMVVAYEVKEKTAIWCPFCNDSEDVGNGTASAVIFIPAGSRYSRTIYCSHCGKNYYSKRCYPSPEEATAGFYAHGTSCSKVQLTRDEDTRRMSVSVDDIGWRNAFLLMDVAEQMKQTEIRKYLLEQKLVPSTVGEIELSDMNLTAPQLRLINGVWEVRHPAIPVEIADNDFVEAWLKSLFGEYTDFVKQWLAVYTYTNHKRLPFILLYGPKGSGKTIFGDVVSDVYQFLSSTWKADDSEFTGWAEKKLLVADETMHRRDPRQYARLKQLAGQEFVNRNEKFQVAHDVRNNLNVIIMSNDSLPIFVEKEELPSKESNNQFFVYEMKVFEESKRDNQLHEKIRTRLGHYIRTELKRVFEAIGDNGGYRFQILTPITEYEKRLFALNVTSIESTGERFIEKLADKMETEKEDELTQYLNGGYVPAECFCNYLFDYSGHHREDVIRWLAKTNRIDGVEKSRPRLQDVKKKDLPRRRCYTMTDKLKAELKALVDQSGPGTGPAQKNKSDEPDLFSQVSDSGPVDQVDRG